MLIFGLHHEYKNSLLARFADTAGNNEFWVQEELDKKLKKYGTAKNIQWLDTINDLFLAWSGFIP